VKLAEGWGIGDGNSVEFFDGIHYREKTLTKILEFFHLACKKLENENCSNACLFARSDPQPIRNRKQKSRF
jgi:hypothetical protein